LIKEEETNILKDQFASDNADLFLNPINQNTIYESFENKASMQNSPMGNFPIMNIQDFSSREPLRPGKDPTFENSIEM
jgi:hypothetical protein